MKKLALKKLDTVKFSESGHEVALSKSDIAMIGGEFEVDGKKIVQLNIITDEKNILLYINREGYITYDLVDCKWRTGSLDNTFFNCYSKYKLLVDMNTKQLIENLLENISNKDLDIYLPYNLEADVLRKITALQNLIKKEKLRSRRIREKNEIDEAMKVAKPLPKDMHDWVDKAALYNSRYIFYTKNNGYCSHCESNIIVNKPKHNSNGICPNCSTSIVYKANGYSKKIEDRQIFTYIQKTENKNQFMVRVFIAAKEYINGRKDSISLFETRRYIVSEHKTQSYYMGSFYHEYDRWCCGIRPGNGMYYGYSVFDENFGLIYRRNLKRLIKGSFLEYSLINEIDKPIHPVEYIYTYLANKNLEKIKKLGYSNLFYNYINNTRHNTYDCDLGGNKITEILKLDRNGLSLLKIVNGRIDELELLKKLKEYKMNIDIESLKFLMDKGLSFKMIRVLKYISPKKAVKYIKKTMNKDYMHLFTFYADYLDMAAEIGYDLSRDIRLFPINLKKAHDEATDVLSFFRSEIEDAKIVNRYKESFDKWQYETKKLIVEIPKNAKDLVVEGKLLKHCVAGKVKSVSNKETNILFIRKKSNKKEPYFTLEVKDNRIVQCYGYDNEVPKKDITNFLTNFKQVKGLAG